MERLSGKNKFLQNNLADTDKNAIEYISRRNDLITTKADKSGKYI